MSPHADEQRYLRAAIEGASSVTLVVLLYDRLMADVQRALTTMQNDQIEARCSELKHAFLILAQLEGSLDHERGGDAARNLALFYSYARGQIMQAQIKIDPAMLQELVRHFQDVKRVWQKVDGLQCPSPASGTLPAFQVFSTNTGEQESLLSCKA